MFQQNYYERNNNCYKKDFYPQARAAITIHIGLINRQLYPFKVIIGLRVGFEKLVLVDSRVKNQKWN